MATDYKQKAAEIFARGKQLNASYDKYKKKYDEAKKYYDLARNLIDDDTRRVTIFKEILSRLIDGVGKLIGVPLKKHPYYKMNEQGLKVLFEAIQASDTVENARKKLKEGEKNMDVLRAAAEAYVEQFEETRRNLRSTITSRLMNLKCGPGPQFWYKEMTEFNRNRFGDNGRFVAELIVGRSQMYVEDILEELRPLASSAVLGAQSALESYLALAAGGADVIALEKAYNDKIQGMVKAKTTVTSTFGKKEQEVRTFEKGDAALQGAPGGGDDLQEQVKRALSDPSACAGAWADLAEDCLSQNILLLGFGSSYVLPWNYPLPPN